MYTIHHHGAGTGVTGSCHQLTLTDGRSLLVDCGLFQGAEVSASGRATAAQLAIDFPIDQLQALVVTHVHIDHVGRIPYLLAAGFAGPILCSEASAQLLPLVIEDALKVGFTRDRALIERVLTHLQSLIVPLPYQRWHTVIAGDPLLRVKLSPAGHILGSAYVQCQLRSGGGDHRILFSGDLGSRHTPLLPAPQSPWRADVVVLESTYGDRNHPPRRQRYQQLKAVVEQALADRGTVLIPAFSIGRTQELLYELEHILHRYGDALIRAGLPWADLEVIVDSPLAADFTRHYRTLSRHWDREAKRRLRQGRHPLAFDQLLTIDDHATHLQTVNYLARSRRPAIVIAASGMCSGGRVVNYLKALLTDPRHDILFVGYQAAGTPGRDIQHYGPRGGYVLLDGQRYDIRARIHTLSGYSAHADQSDLIRFIRRMRFPPKQIRLVHGDPTAQRTLQQALQSLGSGLQVLRGAE